MTPAELAGMIDGMEKSAISKEKVTSMIEARRKRALDVPLTEHGEFLKQKAKHDTAKAREKTWMEARKKMEEAAKRRAAASQKETFRRNTIDTLLRMHGRWP